jgi:hypothetical protein
MYLETIVVFDFILAKRFQRLTFNPVAETGSVLAGLMLDTWDGGFILTMQTLETCFIDQFKKNSIILILLPLHCQSDFDNGFYGSISYVTSVL